MSSHVESQLKSLNLEHYNIRSGGNNNNFYKIN